MSVEQDCEVEPPPAAVHPRGEGRHVRLQLPRDAQHLFGVALAGARQLFRGRQQLLRVGVSVLRKQS